MTEPRAQRTLVKSPPELWAEISDVDALARHLGEFGEIRITRLEPETTVAWEGDTARGTVELQASGWGTKVVLTAQPVGAEAPEPVAVEPEPEPVAVAPEPVAVAPEPADATVCNDVQPLDTSAHASEAVAEPVKVGFFARLFGRKPKPAPVAEPVAVEPEPEPVVVEPEPVEPEPEPVAEPVAVELEPVEPEPVAVAPAAEPALDPAAIEAVLTAVLDDLGSAHHRPFSR